MNNRTDRDQFDIYPMIARPLYFGMFCNVLFPMGMLFVCYYFQNNDPQPNRVGEAANLLFYLFGALSLIQAGLALWWRIRSMREPMVRRRETMEQDITAGLAQRSRPVFLLVAGISLWGIVYYFLTGRFQEAVFLVVFSFIVFQVVRPRRGLVLKVIRHQQELVDHGRYLM
jgi:hypothetical protein